MAVIDIRMPALTGINVTRQLHIDDGATRVMRPKLTDRELAVLELLAAGKGYEEIGARLSLGPETVRTHVRKASARLQASTRTQVVAAALRLGLIE